MNAQHTSYLLKLVVLFTLYFVTGYLGLQFNTVSGFASLVWLPTGISLAALLLYGYRLWPAITLGAFFVNFMTGATPLAALSIAVGNTLEALLGFYLYRRLIGKSNSMDNVKDVAMFIIIVAPVSTLISATIGVSSLLLSGLVSSKTYLFTWSAWWIGDLVSNLLIAPFILLWKQSPVIKFKPREIVEIFFILIVLLITYVFVFFGFLGFNPKNAPIIYMTFFPIILVALRFDPRITATTSLLLAFLAIWATTHGQGPFAGRALNESLIYLQGFMIVMSSTSMILSTAISDQRNTHRRKNEFISLASHELKTPVTTIKAYTQILHKMFTDKKEKQALHYLSRMDSQLNKLTRLVTDLLDMSKILADKLDLHKEVFPLQKLIKECVEDIKITNRTYQITLKGQLEKNVYVDQERIAQVIENLLSNAIKYSPKNKKVEVNMKSYAEKAVISIKDYGMGIDEKYQDKIFQRFFRVEEKNSQDLPGLGLGLFLSKEIIKRHGGELWVKSKPKRGSTFFFSIPFVSDK